ncbi:MAG: SDR family oxidoreductase [Clostridiaceae bacterium]|nr:SDR family oxidoreductase [Clostridiaceae bacterium]
MDLRLREKVAVITGGSTGIGLAVAKGLAEEGVNIVLCARNKTKVTATAEEISRQFGVKVIGISADVSKSEDNQSIINYVSNSFGGVDILINNAGAGSNEKIITAPDEKWNYYWNLHVMAAVQLSRGLAPMMRERGGGVIINNASLCAKQPLIYEPIYNVTKSALMMFSKVLSNELIDWNIRVNCINPGAVITPDVVEIAKQLTNGKDINFEEYLNRIVEKIPIKRFARPEELADFFVFLCSDRASYCVGSTYYVDGGWLNTVA